MKYLALLMVLLAGCGSRSTVATAPGFDPARIDRVAVLVDRIADKGGARSPSIEARLAQDAQVTLMALGYQVAAVKLDQRDVTAEGRSLDSSPLSDADARRVAVANGLTWIMIVQLLQNPVPVGREEARGPCAVAARLVDVDTGMLAWSSMVSDQVNVLVPFDPYKAIDEAVREAVRTLPPCGRISE